MNLFFVEVSHYIDCSYVQDEIFSISGFSFSFHYLQAYSISFRLCFPEYLERGFWNYIHRTDCPPSPTHKNLKAEGGGKDSLALKNERKQDFIWENIKFGRILGDSMKTILYEN